MSIVVSDVKPCTLFSISKALPVLLSAMDVSFSWILFLSTANLITLLVSVIFKVSSTPMLLTVASERTAFDVAVGGVVVVLVASGMAISFSWILLLSTATLITLLVSVMLKVSSTPMLLTMVFQRTAFDVVVGVVVVLVASGVAVSFA